jgi:hypothetical protein
VVQDVVWDCLGWGRGPLLRIRFGTVFGTLLEEEISLARQGNLNRIFLGFAVNEF